MRALLFHDFGGPLTVETVPDPEPPEGGVVVQVERTGLCRSDWHGWQGHDPDIELPHVPGHEFAGTVVARHRSVTQVKLGARVTVPFVSGCGACPPCCHGNPQVCDHQFQPGFTHFGSFAELVALRYADTNVVHLPESLGAEQAASLGCRFVTAYRALVELADLKSQENLVIFGAGGVGLSALLIAKALGARTLVVDISETKLQKARALGADELLLSKAGDGDAVVADVVERTRGGAQVSLDALGSTTTLRQSLLALAKRGRHVQVGLLLGEGSNVMVPVDRIVAYELQLFGSHGIAARSYPKVFQLLERGRIDLGRLVNQTVGLEDVGPELARMQEFSGVGITLVDPSKTGS